MLNYCPQPNTVLSSLYVALPISPGEAVQRYLDTFPTANGRPLNPADLHVSILYGNEFGCPVLDVEGQARFEQTRQSIADGVTALGLAGTMIHCEDASFENLGGAFWGITVPAPPALKEVRLKTGEIIAKGLGVKLPHEEWDELHVSMVRQKKNHCRRSHPTPPTYYPGQATFMVSGEARVDIVATTSAAIDRKYRLRRADRLQAAS